MTDIDYKQLSLDFARSAQVWQRAAATLAKRIHRTHLEMSADVQAEDITPPWHDCTHPDCVDTRELIAAAADSGFGI